MKYINNLAYILRNQCIQESSVIYQRLLVIGRCIQPGPAHLPESAPISSSKRCLLASTSCICFRHADAVTNRPRARHCWCGTSVDGEANCTDPDAPPGAVDAVSAGPMDDVSPRALPPNVILMRLPEDIFIFNKQYLKNLHYKCI